MLDRSALEGVARLVVAELAPAAPSESQDRDSRAPIDVSGLVGALEAALQKVVGQGEVVVLRRGSSVSDTLMLKLLERLPALIEARKQALTEKNIEALVDAFLPADALASVMPDIEADNARAQADFVKTYPTLTSDQIAARAGHGATNRSATANRWKGEGKIFSIRFGGREVYPAFQFEDGRPRSALRPTLKELGSRSGWQTAFWFVTPNSWLGGHAPIDRLEDAEGLAAAAAQEAEAWAG